MTQSAVSQAVHQLEKTLGVRLIDRSRRPLVPTPEGEVCYRECQELLARWRYLEESFQAASGKAARRVEVASIYSVGLSHMNVLVGRFLKTHPRANVRLQYQHPRKVYRLVEEERVDVGLVSYPVRSRTIEVLPWREEVMVLVVAPDHPFAGREDVAIEELSGQPMVGFDDDLRIRQEIDRALRGRGVRVRVAMVFDNIETIKRAVEINAGISLLPWPTVVREVEAGTLLALSLRNADLKRPLGMICRKGRTLGPTAQQFAAFLQAHADVGCPPFRACPPSKELAS